MGDFLQAGPHPHLEPREDPLPVERSPAIDQDRSIIIRAEKRHPTPFVVQGDPYLPGKLVQTHVGTGGCQGVISLQRPNALLGGEAHGSLPLRGLSGHPYSPDTPLSHLHLPKMPPRGETLAAQHARLEVESLWVVREVLGHQLAPDLFSVLGEMEVGVSRGWVQGHVGCRRRENKSNRSRTWPWERLEMFLMGRGQLEIHWGRRGSTNALRCSLFLAPRGVFGFIGPHRSPWMQPGASQHQAATPLPFLPPSLPVGSHCFSRWDLFHKP